VAHGHMFRAMLGGNQRNWQSMAQPLPKWDRYRIRELACGDSRSLTAAATGSVREDGRGLLSN